MNRPSDKVCIVTFGCQMNKLDSDLLRGELARAGFSCAERPEEADVVLYNTCSVRDHAEHRVLSHLGAYRRRAESEPDFVLGVIGCMAQRMADQLLARFPFVDVVCGTRAFLRVPAYIRRAQQGGGPIVDVGEESPGGRFEFDRAARMRQEDHSAYVSVMRGCDNFCAYCIVPFVRGRESSRPPQEVVREVRRLADDGVREVTLLGQNVNSYGGGLEPPVGLADLLERVNGVDGIERVRFVTSHPRDMTDGILRAMAGLEKVCEHLHVPAQSGSDVVLGRMRRDYTAAQYRDMVARARELVPGLMLAGDFIVGFPGETERDFRLTLRLLREVRYQQSFIFKYSPRPGTAAARWEDDVPDRIKRERNQALLVAQEEVDTERRAGMVGRRVEVLVDGLSKADERHLSGRTRGNDIVVFDPPQGARPENLTGRLVTVELTDSTPLTLFGRLSGRG